MQAILLLGRNGGCCTRKLLVVPTAAPLPVPRLPLMCILPSLPPPWPIVSSLSAPLPRRSLLPLLLMSFAGCSGEGQRHEPLAIMATAVPLGSLSPASSS